MVTLSLLNSIATSDLSTSDLSTSDLSTSDLSTSDLSTSDLSTRDPCICKRSWIALASLPLRSHELKQGGGKMPVFCSLSHPVTAIFYV